MKDFELNAKTIGLFIQELWKLDLTKSWRISLVVWRKSRSLSQNSFQHVIYGEISKYLISKGRDDWTPAVVKRNMKNNFLGWEAIEYTDITNGEVTIRSELLSTSKLDAGVACDYITKLLDWAQTIGCEIKIPNKCDYRDYLNLQDE